VCKVDLILVVPNVLTGIIARHLPLFQYVAIAFRMFFLSASFIVPLVQCYSTHCLAVMLIAQPMMMQQRCDMFHIALNF